MAERKEAERRRREREEAKAKERRLDALEKRGEAAWKEAESLAARRSPSAYDRATALLCDLRDLSLRQGTDDEFHSRLMSLRSLYKGKPRFIERLDAAGLD